jgi:hypothetical protein
VPSLLQEGGREGGREIGRSSECDGSGRGWETVAAGESRRKEGGREGGREVEWEGGTSEILDCGVGAPMAEEGLHGLEIERIRRDEEGGAAPHV